MLRIVCFKWKPLNFYRSQFDAQAVNTLYNMVCRNLRMRHEFVCITDNPEGIDSKIRIIPLWPDVIRDYGGYTKPNCFRRLRAFSPEMERVIGERFCWLDLDCVITSDITSLLDVEDDFKIYKSTNPKNHYNGSMVLMDAGARKQVWEDFTKETPALLRELGYVGSDQAWISHKLGGKEKKFTIHDGVYAFNQMKDYGYPSNSKIIFFPGKYNPWQPAVKEAYPWVRKFYL